jgi:hypothetical protein
MCGCGSRIGSRGDWSRRGPRGAGRSGGCGCRSGCGCEPAGPTTAERREAMERDRQRLEQQLNDINEELGRF